MGATDDDTRTSRREFLRRTGIGAAGLAIGGSAAAAVTTAVTVHPRSSRRSNPATRPGSTTSSC
jgi:phospholipase C